MEPLNYLKSVGIYACGNTRLNCKGLLQLCKDKDLKRGEFNFQTDQALSYLKWIDNQSVHVLSNFHGNEACKIQRKKKDNTRLQLQSSQSVKDYNLFIWGGCG